MTNTVRDVLRAFDALTAIEQRQAAAEIMRRPLPDADSEVAPPCLADSALSSTVAIQPQLSDGASTLDDWNAYYQLLLSGQLKSYGGKFVVVHNGQVVAFGDDPQRLRRELAERLSIAEARLVIAFVELTECIVAE